MSSGRDRRSLPAWLGLLILILLLPLSAVRAQTGTIERVIVQGLRRMSDDAFRHALGLKEGDPYDREALIRLYRDLWDMGIFDDLTFEVEDGPQGGVVFIVKVVERPTLASVTYEENKVATRTAIEDRLRERDVPMKVGGPLDMKAVFRAEGVIRDLLGEKGYLNPTVRHRVDEITPSQVAVRFTIRPGGKTRIRKIDFVGNEIYGDRRIKQQLKLTRAFRWYWPWSGKALYHPAKWDQDSGEIRDLYLSAGYLDVEIRPPVVETREIIKRRRAATEEPGEPAPEPDAAAPAPDAGEPEAAAPADGPDEGLSRRQIRRRAERERRRFEKERKREEKEARRAEPKVKAWVELTVPIREGKQYRLGEVAVTGNTVLADPVLRALVPIRKGDVINMSILDDFSIPTIQAEYQNRGYAYATARREISRHPDEAVADIEIIVTEDKPYYISRIEFSGNTATKDRVLRREMRIAEGELFSKRLLDLSVGKVNQLGYFEVKREDVIVKPVENENRVEITVPGEERGRNEIQVGGGYSGLDGAFFQGLYSTRNFLGRGQILSTSIQVGGRTSQYQISFQEPWFLGRPYTLGFNVFRRDIDYGGNLTSTGSGGGIVLGKQFGFFTNVLLRYDFQKATSTGFTVTGAEATNRISSLTPVYIHNRIDNPYRPSRGWSLTANLQVAGGPLGGDTSYLRPVLAYSGYKRVFRGFVGVHAEAGQIRPWQGGSSDNTANVFDIPRLQRFWMGGDTQGPRVFETRTITPLRFVRLDAFGRIAEVIKDPIGRDSDDFDRNGDGIVSSADLVELGGDRYYLVQAEYVIPFRNSPVEIALFADFGSSLFEDTSWGFDELRVSAGVEMRFYLPVFPVPLRLIYGVPVREQPFDRTSNFTFSIGRSF